MDSACTGVATYKCITEVWCYDTESTETKHKLKKSDQNSQWSGNGESIISNFLDIICWIEMPSSTLRLLFSSLVGLSNGS